MFAALIVVRNEDEEEVGRCEGPAGVDTAEDIEGLRCRGVDRPTAEDRDAFRVTPAVWMDNGREAFLAGMKAAEGTED